MGQVLNSIGNYWQFYTTTTSKFKIGTYYFRCRYLPSNDPLSLFCSIFQLLFLSRTNYYCYHPQNRSNLSSSKSSQQKLSTLARRWREIGLVPIRLGPILGQNTYSIHLCLVLGFYNVQLSSEKYQFIAMKIHSYSKLETINRVRKHPYFLRWLPLRP